ncbi:MAG: glycosyltransferase [Bacteroidota bacterium]|nr:glycosyltransferase [Bacteroidota bacterium]
MLHPKISIVTPNYNYAKYIGETIQSIIDQGYNNFEQIIIDDGSTDNSIEVIQKFVDLYPDKIKLFTQTNKGQTPSINRGLKLTTGEIIGWINSDDTYCKNTFKLVAEKFEKNPKADIVFGDMNAVDLQGNFIYRRRHTSFNFLESCFAGFNNTLTSNAVFWTRKTMEATDYLDESLKCNMDGEYYSRLTRNMNVVRINAPLANFRQQPYTKASEKNSNWREIVNKEMLFESKNVYSYLKISKYIPYEKSGIIRFFFRTKRIIKRFLSLHYFLKYMEIKKYKKIVDEIDKNNKHTYLS